MQDFCIFLHCCVNNKNKAHMHRSGFRCVLVTAQTMPRSWVVKHDRDRNLSIFCSRREAWHQRLSRCLSHFTCWSSMHSSSAARCWQALQRVSVKYVRISRLANPPPPHPPTPNPLTLWRTMSHSFELRKRDSLHWNVFEIMEDKLKTVRIIREETKVCERKEMIRIFQTNKLLQQQHADRAGDRQ